MTKYTCMKSLSAACWGIALAVTVISLAAQTRPDDQGLGSGEKRQTKALIAAVVLGTQYESDRSVSGYEPLDLSKEGFLLRYVNHIEYEKELSSGETYKYESLEVHVSEIKWANVKSIRFKSKRSKKGNVDRVVDINLKEKATERMSSESLDSRKQVDSRKITQASIIFQKDAALDEFIAALRVLDKEWKLNLTIEDASEKKDDVQNP